VGLGSLIACAGGGDSDSGSSSSLSGIGGTVTTSSGQTDSASDPTDSATDGGETSSSDGGEKLDVAGGDTGDGTTPPSGCGKVDMVFVIDNSDSMLQYQQALADAFPGFISAVYDTLPANVDLHVGITTTTFPATCVGNEATDPVGCKSSNEAGAAANYDKPTTGDNGVNGAQGRLFFFDGRYFFEGNTSDDPAALTTWFTGAAVSAGTNGCTFEMPVAAASWAVDSVNAQVNADNEGFLRDEEALLVIFFLTDEPDKSPDTLTIFEGMVRDSKPNCGGDVCIFATGLIPPCTTTTNQKLWKFIETFGGENPFWGDISDTDNYAALVGQSLAQGVGDACLQVPPVE
jgi:hypothetical protein